VVLREDIIERVRQGYKEIDEAKERLGREDGDVD